MSLWGCGDLGRSLPGVVSNCTIWRPLNGLSYSYSCADFLKCTCMQLPLVQVRQNFSKYLRGLSEPIVILNHRKAVAVLSPFTEEEELYRSMKAGEITYDDYRRKMLGVGYSDLVKRKVLVKPSDIVAAEKLEEDKKVNRIEAAEFLLDAARYWAGRSQWQICPNCSHMMLPRSVYEERKTRDELLGQPQS